MIEGLGVDYFHVELPRTPQPGHGIGQVVSRQRLIGCQEKCVHPQPLLGIELLRKQHHRTAPWNFYRVEQAAVPFNMMHRAAQVRGADVGIATLFPRIQMIQLAAFGRHTAPRI